MESNDYIKNNRDLPCLINNDYIDDNNIHLPVARVSVLVTADNNSDEKLKNVILTMNTNGDCTKNTNVDMTYDKVMMGGNPMHYYYYGTMEEINCCLLYTSRCV